MSLSAFLSFVSTQIEELNEFERIEREEEMFGRKSEQPTMVFSVWSHAQIDLNDDVFDKFDASSIHYKDDQNHSGAVDESVEKPPDFLLDLFPGLRVEEKRQVLVPLTQKEDENLQQKIEILTKSVEALRIENSKLRKEQADWKKAQQSFDQQKAAFEEFKAKEQEKIENWKQEEIKNMRRERIVWEKQRKVAEILPSKRYICIAYLRERKEIEDLKKEILLLTDAFKQKEKRLNLSNDRLRKTIDDLNIRNQELLEEVKILEQERIELMQRNNMKPEQKRTHVRFASPKGSSPKATESERSSSSKSNGSSKRETATSLSSSTKKSPAGRSPLSNITTSTMNTPTPKSRATKTNKSVEMKEECTVLAEKDPSETRLDEIEKCLSLPRYLKQISLATKVQRYYPDASKLELYHSGVVKATYPSGYSKLWFVNGDTKEIYGNEREIYTFKNGVIVEKNDGIQIEKFPDGQVIYRYQDGNVKAVFPDGIIKWLHSDGREEIIFS